MYLHSYTLTIIVSYLDCWPLLVQCMRDDVRSDVGERSRIIIVMMSASESCPHPYNETYSAPI